MIEKSIFKDGANKNLTHPKKENAITLIALVVTIVVLLILAGVSISMLTGENGIITQSQDAKDKNKEGKIEEQVRLAVMAAKTAGLGDIDIDTLNSELDKIGYEGEDITSLPVEVEIDEVKVTIKEDGNTESADSDDDDNDDPTEPTTLAESKANELDVSVNTTFEDTKGDSITIPAGFNVDKDSPVIVTEGIVVEDSQENQYVWIPVFEKSDEHTWGVDYSSVTTAKTAEKTDFTTADYTAIQTALKAYTNTYKSSHYSDVWYGDSTNATYGYYNGEKFIYYTNGNMKEDEYNELYNNMLVSVYKNAGFYIGRYEMGAGVATSVETAESLTRTSMTEYTASWDTNTSTTVKTDAAPSIAGMATPVSKANAVGYTCITQNQAQMLAEKMGEEYGYGSTTSSLMFGVQWDAVCVFLEKYGKLSDGTAFDSSYLTDNAKGALWGNYRHSKTFTMDRGYHNIFDDMTGGFSGWKEKSERTRTEIWLCTTGASDQNSALNIYDFGGNLWELTLEGANANSASPVIYRGSSAYANTNATSSRANSPTYNVDFDRSARLTLYL